MEKQNILFVNCCVRRESRTKRLAEHVLRSLDGEITEEFPAVSARPITTEDFLLERNEDSEKEVFSEEKYGPALRFAAADVIVIAAPYWDLSFPAVLKAYFEQLCVLGLTFTFSPEGVPGGLCKAKKLIFVTTAGGPILSDEFGFGYVKALAQTFYGIPDVTQVKAEGLDIVGADVEKILREAMARYDSES
jgi:FMN-dependent NADH-azoreductase